MISAKTIRITTIVENSTSVAGVLAEWGISVFIEAGEKSFLLDTGASSIAVRNTDKLTIGRWKAECLEASESYYRQISPNMPP